jgi:hypothetical protein
MRDPASPTRLRADWDSGDHIHPNTAGYAAMANAVPLEMLLLDSEDANARPDRLATARLG